MGGGANRPSSESRAVHTLSPTERTEFRMACLWTMMDFQVLGYLWRSSPSFPFILHSLLARRPSWRVIFVLLPMPEYIDSHCLENEEMIACCPDGRRHWDFPGYPSFVLLSISPIWVLSLPLSVFFHKPGRRRYEQLIDVVGPWCCLLRL